MLYRSCHEFGSRVDAKMHFIKCLRGDRVVLSVMEAAVDALPDGGDRLAKGGLGSAILVGFQSWLDLLSDQICCTVGSTM